MLQPRQAGRSWPVLAGTLPAVAVAVVASGVRPDELLRFVLFHSLWVLGPGIVAARLLLPAAGGFLPRLAWGWALGYCLEIGVFAATAAAGAREAFLLWPLVAAAVVVLTRRRPAGRAGSTTDPPARTLALLAAIAVALVVHLAAVSAYEAPLSPPAAGASYFTDYQWHLALAADALHHWPVGDPQIAGEPMPYHVGSALDAAAAAQVTGVPLPEVVSRLQLVPLLLALAAGFALLASALGAASLAPAALGLYLLVGHAWPDEFLDQQVLGARGALETLYLSTSFLLGAVLFAPLVVLLRDLAGDARRPAGPGPWIALTVLLLGCAAAKSVILPLTGAALGLLVLERLLRRRPPGRPLASALGMHLGVYLLAGLTLYAGAGTFVDVAPLGQFWALPEDPSALDRALAVPATALSAAALVLPPLLGLAWLAREHRRDRLLPAVVLVGVVATLILSADWAEQLYLFHYALIPGTVLSAIGLRALWRGEAPARKRAGWALVGVVALAALISLDPPSDGAPAKLRLVQLALVGAAGLWFARRLPASRRPALAVLLLVAALATEHTQGAPYYETRLAARAGLISEPEKLSTDVVSTSGGYGFTRRARAVPELVRALEWIRDRTPPSAVLVTPHRRDGLAVVNDFGYAGFSERRTVLSGTLFSNATGVPGGPEVLLGNKPVHQRRTRLLDALYGRCDADALREVVERHHATHLLIDRTRGEPMPGCLRSLGEAVYDTPQITVIHLR